MGASDTIKGVTRVDDGVDALAPVAPRQRFEDFYRREYPAARRLVWLLTHSDDTDGLVQEAFLAVWNAYPRLDQPGAYLRKAITNSCRQYHRTRATRQRRIRLLPPPVPAELGASEMHDLLADLPYRQRVAIAGRYWAGWSEAEIADALGCRPGTVKSLTSRALNRLRTQMETENDQH